MPKGITGHPVPGGYKYGNLALQVGDVSDETVKYGYRFGATRTTEWLHWKLQTCPLVRDTRYTDTRQQNSDRINIWSQVPRWARCQDILTGWPSVVTWPQTSAVKETTRISSVHLARWLGQVSTFPTVQFTCSHGTFCKSQCNQRWEQVGKDFSGNQPDQLSGFIGLHWTARPIERASVKSNTPSSLPSSNAVSPLQLQLPGHHNQLPTNNSKSFYWHSL
jgi:hypothetical protein